MKDLSKIEKINKVVEEYFKANATLTIAPVKDLMSVFIKAGIFTKDSKKGLPIRLILRELDKSNELALIPFVHAERHGEHTPLAKNWCWQETFFFIQFLMGCKDRLKFTDKGYRRINTDWINSGLYLFHWH